MTQPLTTEQIERIKHLYFGCNCDYVYDPEGGNLKLQLTPLSAITDEDAIQAVRIFNGDVSRTFDAKQYVQYVTTYPYLKDARVHQFLIRRGYAVPLWIDIDHPDNGKNAIELGIAEIKQP